MRIPKQKFFENLSINTELKRIFLEQIIMIYWRDKISPRTVNIAAGESVSEIEVIEIRLNQNSLDKRVLQLIDREVPYYILFLLIYGNQAWIGYKVRSQRPTTVFKTRTYFSSEWLNANELSIRLDGLNMDAVYEGFFRQIAGERVEGNPGRDLKDAVACDEQRQKLQKEIAALENKVRKEKQFNKQVELNSELKQLRGELERL